MVNFTTTLTGLMVIVPILAGVLLVLNLLLAPHKPYEEKVSAYESGFNAVQQTRSIFHIHFWVVCLLFVLFDLEILLLFPIGLALYEVSLFGFTIAMIFFTILLVGFVLELNSGAISLTNKE